MTAIARVTVLDLRTITPYRSQVFIITVMVMAVLANQPNVVVPALVTLAASVTAGYPFQVADKADLDTLYAVLPLSRRSLVFGHYVWGLANFAGFAVLGTIESVVSVHVQHHAFGWGKLGTALAIAWVLFTVNAAIKFPLFVRFGYSQLGMLGTTLPIALVGIAVTRAHLNLPSAGWLGVISAACLLGYAISAAAASNLDPRKVRRPAVRS